MRLLLGAARGHSHERFPYRCAVLISRALFGSPCEAGMEGLYLRRDKNSCGRRFFIESTDPVTRASGVDPERKNEVTPPYRSHCLSSGRGRLKHHTSTYFCPRRV